MASLIAGVLAGTDIVYPMYVFSAVLLLSLGAGLVIGGDRLDGRPVAAQPAPGEFVSATQRQTSFDRMGSGPYS